MENRISKLKTDFNNITTTRSNVRNIFDILQTKIHKLKFMYSEFISNSKTQLFVFGLDSFHFQSKLIDIEYDDMKRLFLAINNRMYCEYFKLYKIIVEYITKNIVDKKISEIIKVNNFPIYKDLEPFKEYKFELVLELHENILILLTSIISNLNSKENELILHQSKKNIGLNIDNFITSFNYEIIMMREKVTMFLTYIEFFHKLHTKYLKRFTNKIQLMYTHINNDIKFDESVVDESSVEFINDESSTGDLTTENISTKNINTTNINTDNTNNNLGYNVPRSPSGSVHSESDDSIHSKFSVISNISDKMFVETKQKSIGGMLKNGITKLLNSCNTITKESVIDAAITNEDITNVFANIETNCESILSNKVAEVMENIEIQIVEVQTQIEENVEDIQNQIEETVVEVQTQIEETLVEVQTQIEEAQTQIEEKVEEAQTQIEEVQNQIEETVEEVQNQIEETVEEVQTQIEEQVEESQNKVDDLVNEVIEEVAEVENNINDDLSVLTEDLNSVTKEDQKTEEEAAKEPKKKRVYKSRKK